MQGNSSKDPYNVQHVWSGRGSRRSRSESCRFCLLLQADALKWPLEAAKLSARLDGSQLCFRPLESGGQPTNIGRPLDQRAAADPAAMRIDAGPQQTNCLAASELWLSHFKSDDGVARR